MFDKEKMQIKIYQDRLQQGLQRLSLPNKFMVTKATEEGTSDEIKFSNDIKYVRNPCRFSKHKLKMESGYVLTFPQVEDQRWKDRQYVSQVFEYFGNLCVQNQGSDVSIADVKGQPLVRQFDSIEIGFIQGLFLPMQIYKIVQKFNQVLIEEQLPWIGLMVQGFRQGLVNLDTEDDFYLIVLLGYGEYVRFSSESDGRGNETVKVVQGRVQ
eukprot:TRINITY_DN9249_c0_g1_i1.p2 TRINITY_DN9249_c0_g1~~TRINITY_DN9249_c0_g1_i1.p2  ORF type:complete len:211 (+),score=17.32 TRINITY_DN9249_c0_g1_i1:449-1081(+)